MQGKTDDAVKCYFRIKQDYISRALEDGRRIHEEVEECVKETGQFPHYLPNLPLINPESEKRLVVPFNEMFDISGVFDVLDGRTIYELKTGVSDSLEWSSTLQIPFYFMMAQIAKIPVDRAFLIHYNQHNETNDWCVIHNSYGAVKKGINLVESMGPEIYEFFDREGLI